MKDKSANTFILVILLVVITLGAVLYYKTNTQAIDTSNPQNDKVQESNIAKPVNNTSNQIKNQAVVKEPEEVNQSTTIVIPSVNESNQMGTTTQTKPITSASTYEHNNRYYYNQLDNYSKIIYDAIASNIGNLKSGNYRIEIEEDFSALLDQADGQEKIDSYYGDAINAINLDIPNIFYLDFSKLSLNIEKTTNFFGSTYRLYIDAGENPNYFLSYFTSEEQVETAIAQIEEIKDNACKDATGNEYTKMRMIHDWFIEYMSYDSSAKNKNSVYGALTQGKAVCEGYARTYKYILDELGINNVLIIGTATNSNGDSEDHMWNYIELDSAWYAVDTTWDDPIISGGGKATYEMKHRYFLIGSTDLYKSHKEKNTISSSGKVFTLPTLSLYKY